MADVNEQKSVASVLHGSVLRSLAEENGKRESLIRQKELLMVECLDVLSSQQGFDMQFGKEFVDAKGSVIGVFPVDKVPEVEVLSSWAVIVKEFLCIGLQLRNIGSNRLISGVCGMVHISSQNSSEQSFHSRSVFVSYNSDAKDCPLPIRLFKPKDVGYLVVRIPIPTSCTRNKLDVVGSWASTEDLDDAVDALIHLNREVWSEHQFLLHTLNFDLEFLEGLPRVDCIQDLFDEKFSWQKLLGVEACQVSEILDDAGETAALKSLPSSVWFHTLSSDHSLLVGSRLLEGVRLKSISNGQFQICAWSSADIGRFINLLAARNSTSGSVIEGTISEDSNRSRIRAMERTVMDIRKLLKEEADNKDGTGKLRLSGRRCRRLNETFIINALH